jgi:uncharacterized membrane protein
MMWLVTLVSLFACGLSAWITARTAGIAGLPGCRANSGCAAIAASRWARWGPVPVSALGAGLYLLLGILAGLWTLEHSHQRQGLLPGLALALAFSAAGAGAWFILLQLAVIRRACLYCNLVHLLGWAALVVLLIAQNKAAGMQTQGPLWAAAGALALLIVGQILLRPRSYAVQEVSSAGALDAGSDGNHTAAVAEFAASAASADSSQVLVLPAVSREVSLLGGRVRLNTADWPLIGSTEAEHWIALLFDYTCPTCRRVHQIVNEAVESHRDRLGVMLLPVPTNPACNPTVKKLFPGRGYSCQYARLAIDVWQSRPDQFQAFDRYMFAEVEMPPLGLAIARAQELTGVRINPHQPDPQQDRVIQQAIEVYQSAELEQIPSLLFPQAKMSGEVKSLAELQPILKQQVGL